MVARRAWRGIARRVNYLESLAIQFDSEGEPDASIALFSSIFLRCILCAANFPIWRNAMQWLYLLAAILGAILPLTQLIPFLGTYGFDLPLFFEQLFQTHVSAFFGIDVIISSFVLWLFVFSEGRRRGMKHLWAYVVANLAIGVCFPLPLFLFFRERKLIAESYA